MTHPQKIPPFFLVGDIMPEIFCVQWAASIIIIIIIGEGGGGGVVPLLAVDDDVMLLFSLSCGRRLRGT